MAGKNTAVFGIFPSRRQAEKAVDVLMAGGFRSDDVSILAPDRKVTPEMSTEKNTKIPEGTVTGVTTGGAIGGTLGLLAGIGALAIPGLGPFIAAGPIMGALAGLGVGGAVGGLVGALVGMGIPEYEAKRYEGQVKDGGILLSVHCGDSEGTNKARTFLRDQEGRTLPQREKKRSAVTSFWITTRALGMRILAVHSEMGQIQHGVSCDTEQGSVSAGALCADPKLNFAGKQHSVLYPVS